MAELNNRQFGRAMRVLYGVLLAVVHHVKWFPSHQRFALLTFQFMRTLVVGKQQSSRKQTFCRLQAPPVLHWKEAGSSPLRAFLFHIRHFLRGFFEHRPFAINCSVFLLQRCGRVSTVVTRWFKSPSACSSPN